MSDEKLTQLIQKIKDNYDIAKQIAKDVWIDLDNEGDVIDYYYFECGFIAGLNYNLDGSLKQPTHHNQQD